MIGVWPQGGGGLNRTFESHHEIVKSVLVLLVGFSIVLVHIFVNGFLNNLNCPLCSERCELMS